MPIKIMKWAAIAALLPALLWRSLDYRIALAVVVTVAAIGVIAQAARLQKYLWVSVFVAIAALFNPVLSPELPRATVLWIDLSCLTAFVLSLVALTEEPRLSIASITDRTPGSQSL